MAQATPDRPARQPATLLPAGSGQGPSPSFGQQLQAEYPGLPPEFIRDAVVEAAHALLLFGHGPAERVIVEANALRRLSAVLDRRAATGRSAAVASDQPLKPAEPAP